MISRSEILEYISYQVQAVKTRAVHVRVLSGLVDFAEVAAADPTAVATVFGYLNTLRPHAKKRAWSVLSKFFTWRVLEGRAASSPMTRVPRPCALSPARPGPPSSVLVRLVDQVEAWCKTGQVNKRFSAYRLRVTLLLALYYGLRTGELCGLDLKDFNRPDGLLSVVRKGGSRTITIPLDPEILDMLFTWCSMAATRRVKNEKALFVNWHGGRLIETGLRSQFNGLAKAAGVELSRGGLHQLRNTMAGKLLDQGKSLQEVANYLGHFNLTSTDHYCRQHFGTKNQTGRDLLRGLLEAPREGEVDKSIIRPVSWTGKGEGK